ncbi:MAG TPA: hypothetical protein DD638_12130, partial [Pasteurellaceae bacterium]|nr:hypothetical protein [Pasteurellaceae bacterium]
LVKLSMVILCIGYAHYQPLKLLKLADNVANLPHKLKTEFSIEEIIHQQRYQTLIIKARLHP